MYAIRSYYAQGEPARAHGRQCGRCAAVCGGAPRAARCGRGRGKGGDLRTALYQRRDMAGVDVMADQRLGVDDGVDRITSYNVCYTKLLRIHHF